MRDRQSIIAVLAVVLVVGAFVVLANLVTNRSDDSTSSALPTGPAVTADPSAAATTSATPTATPIVLPGCTPVPANQANVKSVTAPTSDFAKGKTYTATLTTNCGPLTVELDGTKAPITVSSFVTLAEAGYWNPSPCHRLTGDAQGLWVLQCGDPTGTGSGPGPGYHFGIENAPADGVYPRGTLAMARTQDPNSNGDQFFIVYKDTTLPTTGGGYTIFGKVTAGMDIIDKVAAAGINPNDQTSPLAPISLLTVTAQPKG